MQTRKRNQPFALLMLSLPSEKIDTLCLLVQRIVEENKVLFIDDVEFFVFLFAFNELPRWDHCEINLGAEEWDHCGWGPVRETEGSQRSHYDSQHSL